MKVLPLFYFPPISWFAAAYGETEIAIEVRQNYRKQQYTSRMYVQGSNKIQMLSIPVVRNGENTPLYESKMNFDQDWVKNHWRTLDSAYRRAPYFEYYEDRIEPFYLNTKKYSGLVEFNMDILKECLKMLGMDTKLVPTENYLPSDAYDKDYREAFDSRRKVFPTWYNPEEYTQVFRTFEPDLSILDLISNEGPAAIEIIKRSRKTDTVVK